MRRWRTSRRWLGLAVAGGVAVTAGCSLVSSFDGLYDGDRDVPAPPRGNSDATPDGLSAQPGGEACPRDVALTAPTCDRAIDFQTDTFHCGECGHACGASCADGRCEALTVRSEPSPALLVDGPILYFSSLATPNIGIAEAPFDGGAATVCKTSAAPLELTRLASRIYGIRFKAFMSCPTNIGAADTAVEMTLADPPVAGTLTATADAVFVAFQTRVIRRFDPTSKQFSDFAVGETVQFMRADSTDVYSIGESGGVTRLRRLASARAMQAPDTLATLTAPGGLALSLDDVLFADGDAIYRAGKRDCPKMPRPVVTGLVAPSTLLADERYVYFAEHPPSVPEQLKRDDFRGTRPPLLLSTFTTGTGFTYALADRWVAFSRAAGGAIRKLAR